MNINSFERQPSAAPGLKRLFWLAGAVLIILGFFGWRDRLMDGHADANYGNVVVWGLWVAAYIFFIGLSAGAFLISSLVYVFGVKRFEPIGRLAVFTALVTLVLALLSIVADLGHMDRAWHVMTYANFKSPMAWMIYLYTFYVILLAAEMYFILRHDMALHAHHPGWRGGFARFFALGSRNISAEAAARDRTIVKVIASIGVPVAVMFHGGVGALFGTVASRGHWHSALFPLLFLLSALLSGGALLALSASVFQGGLKKNADIITGLGKLVLGLLALDILFQVSEFLIAFRGGIPGHTEGLQLMLFGPHWAVFWVAQIAVGTFIPLLILISPWRKDAMWVAFACLLVVVGIFAVRLNIVMPGLAVEEVRGLAAAVDTPRMTAEYAPSLSEWLLTAGICGLGLLLFGTGEKLLPPQLTEVDHVRA
jgi:protein NrfD